VIVIWILCGAVPLRLSCPNGFSVSLPVFSLPILCASVAVFSLSILCASVPLWLPPALCVSVTVLARIPVLG